MAWSVAAMSWLSGRCSEVDVVWPEQMGFDGFVQNRVTVSNGCFVAIPICGVVETADDGEGYTGRCRWRSMCFLCKLSIQNLDMATDESRLGMLCSVDEAQVQTQVARTI